MADDADRVNMLPGMFKDAAKAKLEHWLLAQGEPVLPENFDDHAKHIAEHNSFRKSKAYMFAKPEIRQLVDHHVMAHMQMAAEELANQHALEAQAPGLSAAPQDNAPPGSMVPPTNAQLSNPTAGTPPPNPMTGGQAIPGMPPQQPPAENAMPPGAQPPA